MEVLTQNGTCTPPPCNEEQHETPSLKRALENNSPVQANGNHSLSENHHSDNPNTIGCQTALSYPKQDTLVPLTALLQLVNNSILTVMENIEKVLVVNSHDEQLFTPESINSFWQAANSSSATSPIEFLGQLERSPTSNVSPGYQGMDTTTETMTTPNYDIQSDTLSDESSERMRPIVIQDRFKNSLEIPQTEEEEISQPEKKFCPDPEASSPQCFTPPSSHPKEGQYNNHDNTNALSPTVNVAGSLTKYICPYCYKVFNWKTNMNRHISVTHLMKPKPTIKVPIMRKSKPYTCPICGNTFAWRSNMNRHILHLHKIDHKQLNKLLLSAYLPDLRQPDAQQQVQAETTPNFSSLSSLTMLPQNNKTPEAPQYKPDLSQPKTPPTSNAENPISYLYRNHKALLDSVKKEPVPLHIKEAALTSFYQNHKALFDAPQNGPKSVFDSPLPVSTKQESPTDTAFTNVSPRKDHSPVQSNNISPANMLNLQNSLNMANIQNSEISALSALYQSQRAILENTGRQNGQDIPLTSLYQNHKAMLDTVSLLSNLGGMNINNAGQATGDLAVGDSQGIKIKVENGGEK